MASVSTEPLQIKKSMGLKALRMAGRATNNRYSSRGLAAFSVGVRSTCLLDWSKPLMI